jgi:hypothetical protein
MRMHFVTRRDRDRRAGVCIRDDVLCSCAEQRAANEPTVETTAGITSPSQTVPNSDNSN